MPTTQEEPTPKEPEQTHSSNLDTSSQNSSSQDASKYEQTQNSGHQGETDVNASKNLTSEEQAEKLDQQLDERFADFDRLLLREREFLSEKQNEQGEPQNSGGGSSGGGGSTDFAGLDNTDDLATENSGPSGGNETGQQTTGHNPYPGSNTHANTPPDLVNSKGDDVIARQLREAAQKEKDPVLREKLWNEYRKYKSGI